MPLYNCTIDKNTVVKISVYLANRREELKGATMFVHDTVSSNEGILRWFSLDDISDLDMPFTAKYVIQHYLSEGIHNEKLYGGVTSKDGVVFTELEPF